MLVLVAALAAACTTHTGRRPAATSNSEDAAAALRLHGYPAGFGQDNVQVGKPITVTTLQVCVLGAPVRVKAIALNDSKGLRVVDWGQRIWRNGDPGGVPGIATELHVGYTHGPIAMQCPSMTKPATSIVLTVERVGPALGRASSYSIHYAGGSLEVPFGIVLCPLKCSEADLHAAGG